VGTCYLGKCPPLGWMKRDWSACSVTCGKGKQTRSVECVNTETGDKRPIKECISVVGERPRRKRTCRLARCGHLHWQVGDWGACSAQCGAGERKRLVRCVDANDHGHLPIKCYRSKKTAGPRPALVSPCKIRDCEYTWKLEDWGPCVHPTAKCGNNGTQTRAAHCVDQFGASVDEDKCPSEPQTKRACKQPKCGCKSTKPATPAGGDARTSDKPAVASLLQVESEVVNANSQRPATPRALNRVRPGSSERDERRLGLLMLRDQRRSALRAH